MLYAALRITDEKKLPGMTVELIRAMPLCDKPHLVFAAGEAMRAVAQPRDAEALRDAMKSKSVELRVAAAGALGKAVGFKGAAELIALAETQREDKVKVAAARAVANFGDRRSLPILVRLLSSDDVNVRVTAGLTLRALTDKDFSYAAYDVPSKRDEAITKWKSWVAGEGRTAKLHFPLRPLGGGVSYLNGNTLLAYGYVNKVIEFDPAEREVWSYDAPGAWSAEKLANGNVLIAAYNASKVIQVDSAKKVVWEFPCSTPLNAKPLTNGNILIAEYGGGRILEVTPDHKLAWSYTCNGSPTDVHRLDNGNTLLSVNGGGCARSRPTARPSGSMAAAASTAASRCPAATSSWPTSTAR